ncbi:MAG: bifunctional hydroxymethylpyrimidine kinase/phosphomethylpyrimidine kinase [Bacteroidota bacterium]
MPNSSTLKVLCVHSFAFHGTASTKAVMSLLGSQVLPVPSLLLSGLTNLPGIVKREVPFQELLASTFQLAEDLTQQLILYIGYLGSPKQVDILLGEIQSHRDIIQHILVDPVSGDHGKTYVPAEIISAWPKLLEVADWCTPNITEVKLLSGLPLSSATPLDTYIQAFRDRFPNLSTLITSLKEEGDIGISASHEEQSFTYWHEELSQHFGGTGDVFASQFIRYYFLSGYPLKHSVEQAADDTLAIIEGSIDKGSKELLIYPFS